ncbi:hypothetical protein FJTKL_04436 [Diaporthe vaccinii]|uniref:Uncharacterized protein n=1 Tax=Diaporthe vaccinii TaxID=105482 RepID=A0ABR4DT28_9PEZI
MLHIITPVTFAPSLLFIEPVPLPAPQWNTSAPSYKCRSCRCEPLGAGTDTLYYGEGGRVVEGETLEPPPLYSEPAAPEPAVISSSSTGKKRRCLDSPSLESFTPDSTAPPSLKAMRALLDYSLASFKQELKQELRQELKQAFDDSLAAYKQDVAEKLQETEACIVSTVRSEFNDHWADMEQSMMDRVREEMAEAQEDIM